MTSLLNIVRDVQRDLSAPPGVPVVKPIGRSLPELRDGVLRRLLPADPARREGGGFSVRGRTMSVQQPTSVKCRSCGWRGKRVYEACDCDIPCSHTGYGYCPKCHNQADSVQRIRGMCHAPSCNEPQIWKRAYGRFCIKHCRFRQMQSAAKAKGKVVPSLDQLEVMASTIPDMKCPACGILMVWSNAECVTPNVVSLQHDDDGGMRFICLSCNSRHSRIGDDFYTLIGPDRRRCPGCGEVKLLSGFHKSRNHNFGGVGAYCKKCNSIRRAEWRHRRAAKRHEEFEKGAVK